MYYILREIQFLHSENSTIYYAKSLGSESTFVLLKTVKNKSRVYATAVPECVSVLYDVKITTYIIISLTALLLISKKSFQMGVAACKVDKRVAFERRLLIWCSK